MVVFQKCQILIIRQVFRRHLDLAVGKQVYCDKDQGPVDPKRNTPVRVVCKVHNALLSVLFRNTNFLMLFSMRDGCRTTIQVPVL